MCCLVCSLLQLPVSQTKEVTPESMILWAGKVYLQDAHCVCACELFPEEQIASAEAPGDHHSRVLLGGSHALTHLTGVLTQFAVDLMRALLCAALCGLSCSGLIMC